MTRSTLLSREDIYLLFKDGQNKIGLNDHCKDTYYKVNNSCVRRRCLYDREGVFLRERWVDVYGNVIHKPQVGQVLLEYRFTRYHVYPNKIKLDVLETRRGAFVILTRIDCLFLGEDLQRPLMGKVQLLMSKGELDPPYIFYSDPFLSQTLISSSPGTRSSE